MASAQAQAPFPLVEIIADKLYFTSRADSPVDDAEHHYFCIDDTLTYEPFYQDFGPLNLSKTYQFCKLLNELLAPDNADMHGKRIVFYCGASPQFRANAAVLIGAFQVLYLSRAPSEAYAVFTDAGVPEFMPFRDAATGPCLYKLTVYHCIRAWGKALEHNFFDFATFDSDEYDYFECVENGDLNILIPNKFVAFSGPGDTKFAPDGYPTLTPECYHRIFQRYGVQTVVRLNKKMYDKRRFEALGYKHADMFFIDGTTPDMALLQRFITLAETSPGTLAVHCKAGLGRTGTCVGAYLMKHYMLTAAEVIAWLRICRPGSVIGPQQTYLRGLQQQMWDEGSAARAAAASAKLAAAAADGGGEAPGTPLRGAAGTRGSPNAAQSPNAGIAHKQYSVESPTKRNAAIGGDAAAASSTKKLEF